MKGTWAGRPHRGGRTQRDPKPTKQTKKPLSKQWSEAIFEKEDSVIKISYWI